MVNINMTEHTHMENIDMTETHTWRHDGNTHMVNNIDMTETHTHGEHRHDGSTRKGNMDMTETTRMGIIGQKNTHMGTEK